MNRHLFTTPLYDFRQSGSLARAAACGLFALLVPMMSAPVIAEGVHRHDLHIDGAWSRPTPPGAPMGAGYMVISNQSDQEIVLVAGDTPRAGTVSIHETVEVDGLMRMQPLADGLPIPAGGQVELRPMSYHLMFEQLKEPLVEGERIPLTLTFEGAEPVSLEVVVRPLDGDAGDHHKHGHHNHNHQGHDHQSHDQKSPGGNGHSGGHHRH